MSPSPLDAVEYLRIVEELDTEPTLEELSKAIDSLAFGKVPGSDGIPLRLNQALQDHLTAFSACAPLSVLS